MFKNMFENISEKIKIVAQIIFWTDIGGGAYLAIKSFMEAADKESELLVLQGIIIFVVLGLLGLFAGYLMYGFGELIEKTTSINEKLSVSNGRNINFNDELPKL